MDKLLSSQVLDVLQYLGSLRPPVYHRDIKVIGSLQLVLT
jgi:hypothetical protein